jgi:hypothetical protein
MTKPWSVLATRVKLFYGLILQKSEQPCKAEAFSSPSGPVLTLASSPFPFAEIYWTFFDISLKPKHFILLSSLYASLQPTK